MLSELVRVIFVLTELRAVICEYLIRQAPLACTFIEDLYAVLCRRIGKLSCTCYESRGIILVEDVPLPFVFHPIGVPQTVAVASFVPYPLPSLALLQIVPCKTLLQKYLLYSIMRHMDSLFIEDSLYHNRAKTQILFGI